MKPKQPPGEPMTLGNMGHLGVQRGAQKGESPGGLGRGSELRRCVVSSKTKISQQRTRINEMVILKLSVA
jgi:hypothetical protein